MQQEQRHEDPLMPKLSELTARPTAVPIDWFEPTYWNTYLTVCEQADYIANRAHVALPLEQFCKTWEQCAAWKNLPKKEFMEKYGNDVLKQYQMPTQEELDQLDHWKDDNNKSSEDESTEDKNE
ncbi:hypothetical protein H0H81_004033 [Sphagnurus paluster]|uniref:Uncharacterized protein n=1 Tax=Sphagnurus paluster TaxID=117069 RepID=A0A9P7FYU2_9AGAR|nr:hypothetical protein H0H81_004033 [Sphagnurus paluster]